MNRVGRLLAAGVAGFAGLALACPAQAQEARIVEEERVSKRVVELTIETPAFTAPTKVHVYLPTGYRQDRSRRWPVTYFTAGTMNNYNTLRNLVDGEGLTEDYPSIVVSPDGNSGYWSDWFNAGAFGPPKYETYVIDQLIPLIDERYRTIAKRKGRAIFGISMGGFGSLMLAARHPDLVAAAASLSGAVDSNLPANGAVLSISSTFDGAPADAIYGPRATQEVRWRGHNPTDLAPNLRGMHLQLRTANGVPNPGIGENLLSADSVSCVVELGVSMASVNMHQRLERLGIPHLWKDYGPGCHSKPNFTRQIVHTLDSFERALADPPKPPAPFAYRSIEPRFEVFGWKVAADPRRALEFLRVEAAGRRGVTFIGSGQTKVLTAPYFRGLRTVDVIAGGERRAVKPNRGGRLAFDVDLGPPHQNQQYTSAARLAGGGEPGYFRTRKVTFEPHAAIRIGKLRAVRRGPRVCVRLRGADLTRARIKLTRIGKTVARTRAFRQQPGEKRCLRLRGSRRPLTPGRYVLRARGADGFGHRIAAKRRARVR